MIISSLKFESSGTGINTFGLTAASFSTCALFALYFISKNKLRMSLSMANKQRTVSAVEHMKRQWTLKVIL